MEIGNDGKQIRIDMTINGDYHAVVLDDAGEVIASVVSTDWGTIVRWIKTHRLG